MLRKCDPLQEGAESARRKRIGGRKAAVIAFGLLALYFVPLCVRYVEGPSAEEAIEWADKGTGGEYSYALEREYVDEEGRTVYRVMSDSQPAVVMELRREFRWLPKLSTSAAVVPSVYVSDPGPYYEILNEDEWRRSWLEWDSEQLRQEAESGGSLRAKLRQERRRPSEGGPVHETDVFFYLIG